MLPITFLRFLGLFLWMGSLAAVSQTPSEIPRASADPAVKYAQRYELFATRTMARYYEEATFLVKAKVEMEEPPEALPTEEDTSLLGQEKASDLPGLPFLPESLQPASPLKAGIAKTTGGIASVTLDVLVDTSYSQRDVEFIRNLLNMAARLDESRGDKVAIHAGVFPRDNRSLQSYRKPVEVPAPNPVANKPETPGDNTNPKNGEKNMASSNPFGSYTEHLPSLLPLLLICLLILGCVWMISRAISGASRSEKYEKGLLSFSAINSPTGSPVTKSGEPGKENGGKSKTSETIGFRPYLLNCFVGNPKHCGQIIKSWLQRDSEKGLRDSAALVASLDPRLLNVLSPEIGREATRQMEVHLNAGENPSPEDLLTIYKEFKREYDNLSNGKHSEDQYKDLFGFVQQMNEQQIIHILRDESQGIAGLVLAQLSAEMSSSILEKADPENRAKLLIAMGNIDHIPLNVYREIADRLSLKALDVGNMRYVAADGVDSILGLIESLSPALQFQYIHSISEMDLGLGEKIRNRYVTLPELVGLPDKFLSGIIRNLDVETLTLALLHVEEAVRMKMISLMPERMQMMITAGFESNQDKTPRDSEIAQRRLLHRIRDEIRHSGRPA